jgi:hypothetical protein
LHKLQAERKKSIKHSVESQTATHNTEFLFERRRKSKLPMYRQSTIGFQDSKIKKVEKAFHAVCCSLFLIVHLSAIRNALSAVYLLSNVLIPSDRLCISNAMNDPLREVFRDGWMDGKARSSSTVIEPSRLPALGSRSPSLSAHNIVLLSIYYFGMKEFNRKS